MTDTSSPQKDAPVLDFKSATLYAVRVVLHSTNLAELLDALNRRMADAEGFFDDEAVVVDASNLTETLDWKALVAALRRHQLRPIGATGNASNLDLARKVGLEAVDLSHGLPRAAPSPATTPAPAVEPAHATAPAVEATSDTPAEAADSASADTGTAMIIDRPLRSGQRIYARNADLIVVGMVSQGAEVIADGNIHVYGPLRGKAMAGARGDTSARIFTTQLDPELLAIAGVYRVIESELNPQVLNQPAIVHLEGETLQIVPVGTKG